MGIYPFRPGKLSVVSVSQRDTSSEGRKWYSGFGKWGIELWVAIVKGKEVRSQSINVSIPI